MELDREKTELQETGFLAVRGLTLAQVCEIVNDLGIEPDEVFFTVTKRYSVEKAEGNTPYYESFELKTKDK